MMIWIAIAGLIWLACFGFYAVSTKRIAQTKQSRYAFMSNYSKAVRAVAGSLLLLVIFLLSTQFSTSISFVSLWIFISPVLFIFILRMNLFKARK